MINTSEFISIMVCVIGAISISYIESGNISNMGPAESRKNSLIDLYWSNLSVKERWIFWTGCIFVLSPFALAIL
jgi:hypothetical protein